MARFTSRGTYVLHGRGGEMARFAKLAEAKAAAKADCRRPLKWKHESAIYNGDYREGYYSDDDYSIIVEGTSPSPELVAAHADRSTAHSRGQCDKAMRKILVSDLEAFGNGEGLPHERDWRHATNDARVKFPSAEALETDDWGDWLGEVTEHVFRSAGHQLDEYFHDKYSDCPACGAVWGP